MSSEDYSMSTPPMDGEFIDEQQSKWPTVVGTISIVLGSLGILCYGCNSVSTIFQPMMVNMLPPDQQPPPQPAAIMAMSIAQYCGLALLGIWLLVAGIGLCKRSAWAPKAITFWAIARLALTVIFTILTFVFLQDMVDGINQQIEQSAAQQGNAVPFTMTTGIMTIIILVMLVFVSWWPIFILFWMSRATVQRDTAEWAETARTMV